MNTLTQERAEQLASEIYREAAPVIHIHNIGGKRWRRNVPLPMAAMAHGYKRSTQFLIPGFGETEPHAFIW